MKFKPGVPTDTLDPVMYAGLDLLQQAFSEVMEMTVTSTSDGKHMPTSLHYAKPKAKAADVRTRLLAPEAQQAILSAARKRLPKGFQLILESDHLHLEYDP